MGEVRRRGFFGAVFSEAGSVFDEEVDEGGGEAGLDDEGGAAFWRLEIGDDLGDSGHAVFLPRKRHGRFGGLGLGLGIMEHCL